MFATFNQAPLGGVVVLHVALFLGMWVKNIWDVEHLDRPETSIDLAIAPAPPPPPPPAPRETNDEPTRRCMPPRVLGPSRIAGTTLIEPTDATKLAMQRSGTARLVAAFEVCLTASGAVDSVSLLESSGVATYDQTIATRIRGEWRYRPMTVDGSPVRACTTVTFIYTQ